MPSAASAARLVRELCHDLRHPAATIMALAAVLDAQPELPAELRPRLTQIAEEAGRISALCRGVLSEPAPREPVRVDIVAGQAAAAARTLFGITIDLHADPSEVMADQLVVWRVLTNLLDNSCRAAGPMGHVRLRVRTAGATVAIEVADNGPGFGAGPTGCASLGLAIVQAAVRGYGGVLSVEDRADRGTCVTVVLPSADPGIGMVTPVR
jgi:signal transduction histidine kinase